MNPDCVVSGNEVLQFLLCQGKVGAVVPIYEQLLLVLPEHMCHRPRITAHTAVVLCLLQPIEQVLVDLG